MQIQMAPYVPNEIVAYALLALVVLYNLPTWGQRVLAFLRDLDAYRRSRRNS